MQRTTTNRLTTRTLSWTVAGAMSAFLLAPGVAWGINEATSLARGEQPDTTAQQHYQSAVREAGGGLKVAREECLQQPAPERKGCEAQAQTTYQKDIAYAKAMLSDAKVKPVNEVGRPVRSTQTTVVKP